MRPENGAPAFKAGRSGSVYYVNHRQQAPSGQPRKRPDYITDMVPAMLFFADRVAGADLFRRAFETIPIPSATRAASVAALLGVKPATVRSWLAGRREPPRAAVVALWHESQLGRSVTAPHSEYSAYLARAQVDTITAELDAARATIAALSRDLAAAKLATGAPMPGNDPVFNWCSRDRRPRSGAPCTRV